MGTALDRMEYCISPIIIPYYRDATTNQAVFHHLHSDQYAMFLYFLSNELWRTYKEFDVASKVMYLNKVLHSINCMYEVELPAIFCFYHCVGTVIGKSATFSNYFTICHNVTVGSQDGHGPVFEEGVSLLPKCAVVGKSHIGINASVGIGTVLYQADLPDNFIAYTNKNGQIIKQKVEKFYNQTVFER